MRFLFASDSFKGSLSSERTAQLLQTAAEQVFGPCSCRGVPVADGGEGTTEAVVAATHGSYRSVAAHDPLGRDIEVSYGELDRKRAIIEMAAASGLPLVAPAQRNPLRTSTFGTGEMIRDALDRGYDELTIALGGSATNDGGMGCMRALGIRFLDNKGNELEGTGADLEKVAALDTAGLHPRARSARFVAMCDVNNPLCGPEGATFTFGAQKGADPTMLERLEQGMQNYRQVLIREMGSDPDLIPGAGAAGGLGAALCTFVGAELRPGIETVLGLIGFDDLARNASLVVTGEGRTDWQSCYGKVMQGVGERCRKLGVPAVGLCGSLGQGATQILDYGIESLMVTVDAPMSLDQAMEHAERYYLDAAVRMFRFIKVGMGMASR